MMCLPCAHGRTASWCTAACALLPHGRSTCHRVKKITGFGAWLCIVVMQARPNTLLSGVGDKRVYFVHSFK